MLQDTRTAHADVCLTEGQMGKPHSVLCRTQRSPKVLETASETPESVLPPVGHSPLLGSEIGLIFYDPHLPENEAGLKKQRSHSGPFIGLLGLLSELIPPVSGVRLHPQGA